MLHLALIQETAVENRDACLAATLKKIEAAAKKGATLILLQELHGGFYFCQREDRNHFAIAESIPGPTTEALSHVAKKYGVVIVGSIFERRAAGLYHNTAVVIEKDGLVGRYRKMHIPDDPHYYEKFYFTPGDLGFSPIQTSVGKLGILVCWDQWFPEAARLMTLAGADILLYPTAIGWDPADHAAEKNRQLEAWITVQRAHAISNGLPVAACNRVGFEAAVKNEKAGIQFWGNSFICDPQGEILARADEKTDDMILAKIDLAKNEMIRQQWPFLRDRRVDAYQDLSKLFKNV